MTLTYRCLTKMSSDYAESARKRKVFRQAPVADDTPKTYDEHEVAPKTRHKDTKRWCGGKEGRDHHPRCFQRTGLLSHWYDLCCTKCGKQLDYWVDYSGQEWGWKPLITPKPSWVKL